MLKFITNMTYWYRSCSHDYKAFYDNVIAHYASKGYRGLDHPELLAAFLGLFLSIKQNKNCYQTSNIYWPKFVRIVLQIAVISKDF